MMQYKFRIEYYLKPVFKLLVLIICISCAPAKCQINCPKLTNQQHPALVFTEGPIDNTSLYVASFENNGLHKEQILSEKYIYVTQLDRGIFLVSAEQTSKLGKVYVIDLNKGTAKLLFESTRIHCLRTEPQCKTAMLIDSYMNQVRIIELNLETLQTQIKYELSKEKLGEEYAGIGPRIKLSPDFEHIAYISTKNSEIPAHKTEYILRVLDLASMKAEVLDYNVGVQISGISSFPQGTPPFEWINNDEIFYQDMPLNEPNDSFNGLHIFKIVNIKTKKISEFLREELRLTLDGGSLQLNPLNGQLIYCREKVVDLTKKTFTSKYLPFSTRKDPLTKQTQVLEGNDILYSGDAACVSSCISPSGRNFAYSLRYKNRDLLTVKVYAKVEGLKEPIEVAEGPYSPTCPIAWIEED